MGKKSKAVFVAAVAVFICSTAFFLGFKPHSETKITWIDEKELGELCVEQVAVIPDEDAKEQPETVDKADETAEEAETKTAADEPKESGEAAESGEKQGDKEKETAEGDPLVIIYHTHSTESYLPYSGSNYHREKEEGTVRDVGNVLERELKNKGINVVHDKTLHDRPSYNESYGRSLETVKALKAKYPTAAYIIDLHRDAATAAAKEGKYITIDGKRVARFSMVVGKQNENYRELYEFAQKVKERSESMHKGFGGAIIEQNYRYNEFVSDTAMLLEIGNNKNTIEESRLCAVYFAEALASLIKEEK